MGDLVTAINILPDLWHCGGLSEGREIAAMTGTVHIRLLSYNPDWPTLI